MILKKIHLTGCNRSQSSGDSQKDEHIAYLKNQFEQAHTFFVQKIREHNSENKNMFKRVLEILEQSKGKGQRNLNTKRAEQNMVDGLSSQ